jgi:multidrug efflux pump subunit AcrA (membrane-fusion protein)
MTSTGSLPLRSSCTLAAGLALAAGLVALPGCSTSRSTAAEAPPAVDVATTRVIEAPVARSLRLTGTLIADEQAEVSAEVAGRVTATPVERGTAVAAGAPLVQVATDQAAAQLAEAEANAARIAAGLGLVPGRPVDIERVPEVANARAELVLAEAEYERVRSLLDERVVSRSEYDQRRTRVEAARQQLEARRYQAQQDLRSYEAAMARVALARKALADTTIRAPFAGLVAERLVSAGDFVGVGTRVATVVRIRPLRVALTVPEQLVSRVAVDQPVRVRVDAYPGRVFTGAVRHISPALSANQRALTVEAILSNEEGLLKPGLFATAELVLPAEPALLLDARAVQQVGSTARVFVVAGDRLEERIVTTGMVADGRVEIVRGLDRDTVVALQAAGAALRDGLRVRPAAAPAGEAARP